MSFSKPFASLIAAAAICALTTVGQVSAATVSEDAPEMVNQTSAMSATGDVSEKPILIAQACSTCGTELADLAALGQISSSKRKSEALITESLWGNLILDMAYQRDKQLTKIMKKVNILNLGTMCAVSGIAAGTLAQGIVALATLNPLEGHEDSYVPGGIGVGLSAATLVTFAARAYYGHKIQNQVRTKQLAIKDRVESVLDHLERSNCTCTEAKQELVSLVGERASNEWLQLWLSSHKLASNSQPRISVKLPETKLPETK